MTDIEGTGKGVSDKKKNIQQNYGHHPQDRAIKVKKKKLGNAQRSQVVKCRGVVT